MDTTDPDNSSVSDQESETHQTDGNTFDADTFDWSTQKHDEEGLPMWAAEGIPVVMTESEQRAKRAADRHAAR